jgi:1,2-diacylglycerol 3-beta-galactosyltransferase
MDKLRKLEKMARPFIQNEIQKLLMVRQPDIIVSVHPMVNHLTFQAMKDSGRRVPMITVITDPVTFHRVWVEPQVDMLVVATEEAKQRAIEYGMAEEKIKVSGMPIDPKFLLGEKGKENARARGRLKTRVFTILLMGGGEGGGGMYDIIKAIDKAKLNVQLIVIAGRNEQLKVQLERGAKKFSFPIKVHGFTDKVHEIMAQSDLIITKAGPGTIAEALAMNLPIIITSWLPGQEEGNVEFVKKEKVGAVTADPEKVVETIKALQVKENYESILKHIKRVRRPHAAFDIAKLILKYL